MRIYLAGTYAARLRIEDRAAQLWALGHEVTSTWHNGHHETRPGIDANGTSAERGMWAEEDLRDIDRADLLILSADLGQSGRGGAHFEAGYALGNGVHLAVVGETANVFYHLLEVRRFADWPECMSTLARSLCAEDW